LCGHFGIRPPDAICVICHKDASLVPNADRFDFAVFWAGNLLPFVTVPGVQVEASSAAARVRDRVDLVLRPGCDLTGCFQAGVDPAVVLVVASEDRPAHGYNPHAPFGVSCDIDSLLIGKLNEHAAARKLLHIRRATVAFINRAIAAKGDGEGAAFDWIPPVVLFPVDGFPGVDVDRAAASVDGKGASLPVFALAAFQLERIRVQIDSCDVL